MSSRIGKTFVFGGLALAGAVQQGIAATLAGFTFETSLSAANSTGTTAAGGVFGPLTAEVGTGSAFGNHANAAAAFSSPSGNGSLHSFSSNAWASGDNYEFRLPSTGFQDIMLSFDQTRSGTGPNEFQLQYSTDGATYTNFGSTYTLAGTSWNTSAAATAAGNSFAFDLSAISALDNLADIRFRLTSNGLNSTGGTVASGGTNRVDNFFVTGTPIPEPATAMTLVTVAGAASLVRRRCAR